MKPYQLIDHTADIGIHVFGKTFTDLFIHSAEGMTDIIVESKGSGDQKPFHHQRISLKSGMPEELLVKWLEELYYLFEVKRWIPIKFEIRKLTEASLEAHVGFVDFDPKRHFPKVPLKAVTYHNLKIQKVDKGFETTIIFDV